MELYRTIPELVCSVMLSDEMISAPFDAVFVAPSDVGLKLSILVIETFRTLQIRKRKPHRHGLPVNYTVTRVNIYHISHDDLKTPY
jgi:hypothetical protein